MIFHSHLLVLLLYVPSPRRRLAIIMAILTFDTACRNRDVELKPNQSRKFLSHEVFLLLLLRRPSILPSMISCRRRYFLLRTTWPKYRISDALSRTALPSPYPSDQAFQYSSSCRPKRYKECGVKATFHGSKKGEVPLLKSSFPIQIQRILKIDTFTTISSQYTKYSAPVI